MRIVCWNCNMALHNKLAMLQDLKPDIAVLPECAQPDIVRGKTTSDVPDSFAWVGENKHKGLGIIGYGDYEVEVDSIHDPSLRFVVPVRVTGPTAFNLIGVWARHTKRPAEVAERQGPLLRALNAYQKFILSAPTIIGGDFNNHTVFDKPKKANNFTNNVARLKELSMTSGYHHHHAVGIGDESEPTHYWRDRTKDGWTYHIDYVFLPNAWLDGVRSFTIGDFDDWIQYSDHMPLIVDIDIESKVGRSGRQRDFRLKEQDVRMGGRRLFD